MFKRHLGFSISFGLIAILYLVIEILDVHEGRLLVKPLICLILLGYLANKTRLTGNFNKLIFAGLLCSLLGDVALIFAGKGGTVFLIGLGSFLMAHLFYSAAFFRDYRYDPQAPKIFGHIMLFIMAALTIGFYVWIRPYLNDMRLPVMAYMVIISLMAILAAYRYKRVNLASFWLIVAGAVFFIISDSILAINMFVEPVLRSGIWIMSTYMIAQYLITMGTLARVVSMREKGYR
jgi:uncharacterized membrane protein YhhN